MVNTAGCPDPLILEQLALGRMSPEDVERLAEHCEHCARCVEALQRLRAEDTLVEAMRWQSTVPENPLPQKVQEVMKRLKGLHGTRSGPALVETVALSSAGRLPGGDAASERAATEAELTQEVYDFLAPAQGPDELGGLGMYRVLKVLDEGGMGVVFLAEDPELKRRVALKALKPALAASATARQRFLREAQAMAAVQHDYIIHINQIGQEGGVTFVAMPYLEGETLEDRLRRAGSLPAGDVLRIGREVAEGLAAVHACGLIHRDIKPSNSWLEGKHGRVKILDFDLARAAGEQTQLTLPGAIAGTPVYMAREQGQGNAIDHRADLFGLGCVL